MNYKIKALGLALMVALALTAALSSAAQAQFTSSSSHTRLAGAQTTTHKFTPSVGVGSITCSTATVSGTTSATSVTSMNLTPTYSGCQDSLGRVVGVVANSLNYEFTSGAFKGRFHITGQLVLTVLGATHCTITIKPQSFNNGISYSNNLGGTVTIITNTNDIHSSISGGFFACGTSTTTTSSASAGTYTGQTLLEGKDWSFNPASISVD